MCARGILFIISQYLFFRSNGELSTTHRVLSPARGSGARYSVPFFQGVSYDATFESMEVPEHVRALRQEVIKKNGLRQDDIEFTFSKGQWGHLGEATLMNRIKSHPDVGERWVCALPPRRQLCADANVSVSIRVC